MSRWVAAAALVPLGGAAVVALAASGPAASSEAPASSTGLARVERQTLVDRERVDGTLGFADPRAVGARLRGTVTKLPEEGATVRPGEALYRVDEDPVVLLSGRVPAWRDLGPGASGADVRQLERGLRALGRLASSEVDGDYDGDTTDAVRGWQEDLGVAETGRVELGRVVFLPGARRVSAVKAALGDQAGGVVLETTSTRRQVAVDLAASSQQLARAGRSVEVELPSARVVEGRIVAVGSAARAAAEEGGEATVPVTIALRSAKGTGGLDQAPVSVGLQREVRRDVLTVPVPALVALRGGTYGVRRADGRVVRVRPGLAVDGDVEVAVGGGVLRAGDAVRVPR